MKLCEVTTALEQGKAITREVWENKAIVKLIDNKPMLIWEDSKTLPWKIDTFDFIANDYYIVEGFLNGDSLSSN